MEGFSSIKLMLKQSCGEVSRCMMWKLYMPVECLMRISVAKYRERILVTDIKNIRIKRCENKD